MSALSFKFIRICYRTLKAHSKQTPLKVLQWLCYTGLIDSRQTNPRSNYEHQEQPVCSYDVFIILAENRHRKLLLRTKMVSFCIAQSAALLLLPPQKRFHHLQPAHLNNKFTYLSWDIHQYIISLNEEPRILQAYLCYLGFCLVGERECLVAVAPKKCTFSLCPVSFSFLVVFMTG